MSPGKPRPRRLVRTARRFERQVGCLACGHRAIPALDSRETSVPGVIEVLPRRHVKSPAQRTSDFSLRGPASCGFNLRTDGQPRKNLRAHARSCRVDWINPVGLLERVAVHLVLKGADADPQQPGQGNHQRGSLRSIGSLFFVICERGTAGANPENLQGVDVRGNH